MIRARARQQIERAEQRAGKILARHSDPFEALDLLHRRSMDAADLRRWLHDIPAWSDTVAPGASCEEPPESAARAD